MLAKKIILPFIVLTLCLSPVSAFSQSDTDPTRRGALDQSKAEAITLLKQGKSHEAYELYSRLLREAPEDDEVNLGLARSALSANRPNQAIMAYERLLEKYPNEPALYREMAQAYAATGDREMARRYLERDATLAESDSLDLMERFSKRYDRFQLYGKLRAGLLFDSNVNQGPARDTMNIGNFKVYIPHVSEKSSFGAYMGGQVDLGYRLDQVGPWWVVGDGHFFIRGNENPNLKKQDSNYSQWYRASAGFRHLGAESLVDIRAKAEVFDYEFYQNVGAFGPEATVVYAVTPAFQVIGRGGIDRREYSRENLRDGWYSYVGPYGRLFFSDAQHEFVFGGRYLHGDAEKYRFGYKGWEASAAFLFKLPYGFEFSPSISFTTEHYNGPATILESKDRRDERVRVGAGLSYKITEEWSVETAYQYTNNYSKCKIYDYDRHLVSVGIAYTF